MTFINNLQFQQPVSACRAQRQVIDLSEQQRAEDGNTRISAGAATAGGRLDIEPSVKRVRIKPERETSAPDESFVMSCQLRMQYCCLF